jgi:hypothetical protein
VLNALKKFGIYHPIGDKSPKKYRSEQMEHRAKEPSCNNKKNPKINGIFIDTNKHFQIDTDQTKIEAPRFSYEPSVVTLLHCSPNSPRRLARLHAETSGCGPLPTSLHQYQTRECPSTKTTARARNLGVVVACSQQSGGTSGVRDRGRRPEQPSAAEPEIGTGGRSS